MNRRVLNSVGGIGQILAWLAWAHEILTLGQNLGIGGVGDVGP